MTKTTTIGISWEWRDRIAAIAEEGGVTQRSVLEGLLNLAADMGPERAVVAADGLRPVKAPTVPKSAPEPAGEASEAFYDKEHPWEVLATSEDGHTKVLLGDGILVTDDDGEPAVEAEEDDYVKPIVTAEPGQRDRDPVATGCPACERGAPRRGALHNCGKPNPALGSARVGV